MQEVHVIAKEDVGFTVYGQNRAAWNSRASEVILAGPAETGKTRTLLEKLNLLCWKYPNLHCVIIRKTASSLRDSTLVTFDKKVLGIVDDEGNLIPGESPVRKFGQTNPQMYMYPNGSLIKLGGMDNPDKVLSSEYDVAFVSQAEELELNDWEYLTTRVTGRAGNLPWGSQIMADANPGPPMHWILQRNQAGALELYQSRHEDNPVLFDQETGVITDQGKRSLAILDNLTGVRKERLRYGRWVQAEGAVYDTFDRRTHVIDAFDIPGDWRRIRAIDFGYNNPFVCLWIAFDHDGRAYVYRQLYRSRRIVSDHAKQILKYSEGEKIEATICDHDAEGRKTLEAEGIPNQAAYKAINRGIENIQERLRKDEEGFPRMMILRDSLIETDPYLKEQKLPLTTEDEFDSYVWANHKTREVPVDENNHGLDALRYGLAYIDKLKQRRVRGQSIKAIKASI